MTTLDTSFEIAAPAPVVWSALTDFPRYGEWNSAIPSLSGDLEVGSILSMQLEMSGRRPMKVKAQVTDVQPEARFAWRGHLGTEFLFTGLREFTVEPLGTERTRFRHVESLNGLIVPIFLLAKRTALTKHHNDFNESLTKRAEALG